MTPGLIALAGISLSAMTPGLIALAGISLSAMTLGLIAPWFKGLPSAPPFWGGLVVPWPTGRPSMSLAVTVCRFLRQKNPQQTIGWG